MPNVLSDFHRFAYPRSMTKFLDFFTKNNYLIDALAIVIVFVVNYQFQLFRVNIETEVLINLLGSLIDTSVALAGFILAALTIIVTFKSNLLAKKIDEAKTPLELLFSSNNYPKIVNTFKDSIIELTAMFFLLYLSWGAFSEFNWVFLFSSVVSGYLVLAFTIFRSLSLLFSILSMNEKAKKH